MSSEFQELKDYIIEEEMPYLNAKEKVWIQQDGKKIVIWDMSEAHLKNSIKMIEKDIKSLDDMYGEKVEELVILAKAKLKELKDEYINRI